MFEKTGQLPCLTAFQPSGLEDGQPELMYYDVVHSGEDIRYAVTFAGFRLIEAYGFSAVEKTFKTSLALLFGHTSSRFTMRA